jgi:tellurite methyltransferase
MVTYDRHYRQEHLFGEPYPEFVAFVRGWPHRGRALDLGCGQGRDALMLAAAGFQVTAIDVSELGIAQMQAEARERGLKVEGTVADFHATPIEGDYDLIVLDSILHFEKGDREKELALLAEAAAHLRPNGLLCIFVHQTGRKGAIVKDFFQTHYPAWPVVVDTTINYVYEEKASAFRTEMQFNMFFVQNDHT